MSTDYASSTPIKTVLCDLLHFDRDDQMPPAIVTMDDTTFVWGGTPYLIAAFSFNASLNDDYGFGHPNHQPELCDGGLPVTRNQIKALDWLTGTQPQMRNHELAAPGTLASHVIEWLSDTSTRIGIGHWTIEDHNDTLTFKGKAPGLLNVTVITPVMKRRDDL